jgi:hypothetical protein
MGVQSLRKCAITTPQEIRGFKLTKQTEQRRHDKYLNPNMSVIVIRWVCIFFCLAFWYGVYKLFVS